MLVWYLFFYDIKLNDETLSIRANIIETDRNMHEMQIHMHDIREPPENKRRLFSYMTGLRMNLKVREGDSYILFKCFPT